MRPAPVLNGRYRLLERLATGGMGEVWRAADQALGRAVAVKLLRRDLMSDASARRRFGSEAWIAEALRHPGIARLYDSGTAVGVALMHVREAPPELPGHVPGPLRALVGELLAKDPAARPASAAETAARAMAIWDASHEAADLGLRGLARPAWRPRRPRHARPEGVPAAVTRRDAVRPDEVAATGDEVLPGGAVPLGGVDAPGQVWPAMGPGRPGRTPGGRPGRTRGEDHRNISRELSGFDGKSGADNLGSGDVPGRRRTALTYTSVAMGALLLGVVVVGTMWRGLGAAEPARENRERLPAVQPGEGDPARDLPADPATRPRDGRGGRHPSTPARSGRAAEPRFPRASPSQHPTSNPPRATANAPDPTPTSMGRVTIPSAPSPGPAPAASESGQRGSADKVERYEGK